MNTVAGSKKSMNALARAGTKVSKTTSTENTQNMPKRALGNLMDAATKACLRYLSAASTMPSDTSKCATPRTCARTHTRIGFSCRIQEIVHWVYRKRQRNGHDARSMYVLLTVPSGPDGPDAALGTIRPRRRSDDEGGSCCSVALRAGPMKLGFSAAPDDDAGRPRNGEAKEQHEEKSGGRHRGSVQRRAADVAPGRAKGGRWELGMAKAGIQIIMAVVAMPWNLVRGVESRRSRGCLPRLAG
jgi:hypothetical protein